MSQAILWHAEKTDLSLVLFQIYYQDQTNLQYLPKVGMVQKLLQKFNEKIWMLNITYKPIKPTYDDSAIISHFHLPTKYSSYRPTGRLRPQYNTLVYVSLPLNLTPQQWSHHHRANIAIIAQHCKDSHNEAATTALIILPLSPTIVIESTNLWSEYDRGKLLQLFFALYCPACRLCPWFRSVVKDLLRQRCWSWLLVGLNILRSEQGYIHSNVQTSWCHWPTYLSIIRTDIEALSSFWTALLLLLFERYPLEQSFVVIVFSVMREWGISCHRNHPCYHATISHQPACPVIFLVGSGQHSMN